MKQPARAALQARADRAFREVYRTARELGRRRKRAELVVERLATPALMLGTLAWRVSRSRTVADFREDRASDLRLTLLVAMAVWITRKFNPNAVDSGANAVTWWGHSPQLGHSSSAKFHEQEPRFDRKFGTPSAWDAHMSQQGNADQRVAPRESSRTNIERIRGNLMRVDHEVRRFTSEKPVAAVLLVSGTAFLLGRLVSKRR